MHAISRDAYGENNEEKEEDGQIWTRPWRSCHSGAEMKASSLYALEEIDGGGREQTSVGTSLLIARTAEAVMGARSAINSHAPQDADGGALCLLSRFYVLQHFFICLLESAIFLLTSQML